MASEVEQSKKGFTRRHRHYAVHCALFKLLHAMDGTREFYSRQNIAGGRFERRRHHRSAQCRLIQNTPCDRRRSRICSRQNI